MSFFIESGTNIYFKSVKNKFRIPEEVEIEMIKQYQQTNDNKILNEIANSNLRFVVTIAKKYRGMGCEFDDLINAGNIGLIKAIKKFNTDLNFKFSTYAVNWIKAEIVYELANNSRTVRLPYDKYIKYLKTNKMINSDEEISDIDREELFNGKEISNLDNILWMNDNSIDKEYEVFENKDLINKAIEQLEPIEKLIISRIFGLNNNLMEYSIESIAKELKIKQARVLYIKNNAIKKLRKLIKI